MASKKAEKPKNSRETARLKVFVNKIVFLNAFPLQPALFTSSGLENLRFPFPSKQDLHVSDSFFRSGSLREYRQRRG
ncbi:hypothetical protein A0123_01292 [Gluconobacter cerinus]|uniref:Uncharacterized protein n=1 Tax=Gluconobacter cerinus TaxID=38307 RepID=A0A1B6VN01_9PROT|nr:hypothetical protein A0123_01292 [Gluconobacter cerinus]